MAAPSETASVATEGAQERAEFAHTAHTHAAEASKRVVTGAAPGAAASLHADLARAAAAARQQPSMPVLSAPPTVSAPVCEHTHTRTKSLTVSWTPVVSDASAAAPPPAASGSTGATMLTLPVYRVEYYAAGMLSFFSSYTPARGHAHAPEAAYAEHAGRERADGSAHPPGAEAGTRAAPRRRASTRPETHALKPSHVNLAAYGLDANVCAYDDVHAYTIEGLTAGTGYYVRVVPGLLRTSKIVLTEEHQPEGAPADAPADAPPAPGTASAAAAAPTPTGAKPVERIDPGLYEVKWGTPSPDSVCMFTLTDAAWDALEKKREAEAKAAAAAVALAEAAAREEAAAKLAREREEVERKLESIRRASTTSDRREEARLLASARDESVAQRRAMFESKSAGTTPQKAPAAAAAATPTREWKRVAAADLAALAGRLKTLEQRPRSSKPGSTEAEAKEELELAQARLEYAHAEAMNAQADAQSRVAEAAKAQEDAKQAAAAAVAAAAAMSATYGAAAKAEQDRTAQLFGGPTIIGSALTYLSSWLPYLPGMGASAPAEPANPAAPSTDEPAPADAAVSSEPAPPPASTSDSGEAAAAPAPAK